MDQNIKNICIFSNEATTPTLPSKEYWRLSFTIAVSASSLKQMLLMLETLSFVDIIDTNALLFELFEKKLFFRRVWNHIFSNLDIMTKLFLDTVMSMIFS